MVGSGGGDSPIHHHRTFHGHRGNCPASRGSRSRRRLDTGATQTSQKRAFVEAQSSPFLGLRGISPLPTVSVPTLWHRYSAFGLMTVVFPSSVKISFSCARRLLARSIESAVLSIQPDPMSSPI